MRTKPSFGHLARDVAVLAFTMAAASESPAQTIQQVNVIKYQEHLQTSPTAVAPRPVTSPCKDCPYGFLAWVAGQNLASLQPPVLYGPVDTNAVGAAFWKGGQLGYNATKGNWRLGAPTFDDWTSPTLADLESKFGNGVYTMSVNGVVLSLNLSGNAYPDVPLITLTGGSWANGKYVIDVDKPLTVTTSAFTGYGSHVDDAIVIEVVGISRALQFHFQTPGPNTLSITVPANSLTAGQEYEISAQFGAAVDVHGDAGLPGSLNAAVYQTSTSVMVKAQAPVFPMTVTSNIGPTVSNATANIQYRPQDVGTTGSVYTFFVAPSTKVVNAATMDKSAVVATRPTGNVEKDDSVQCVLAQLNQSGQLQAVSASNLQAYVTGILSAQGQTVAVLSNTPTSSIAGSAGYVGYSQDPLSMITSGLNRRALTVPGTVACDPQAPETGWWWNTAEGGRGYSIEVAGNHIFYASYLYDVSGRATWLVASGNTSLDGSLFTGNLEAYAQGQTLSGAYRAPSAPTNPGAITLAFNDARHGTMTWPGGSLPIERFNIVPGGLNAQKRDSQPEGGWWFNPSESGRGFFMEWQGGELFMAGYMYDDNGQPIWYLSSNTTPSTNLQAYQNTWWQYANGQTLTGTFKPATQVSNNVGPVSITFQGSENAIMTLPGGRTTNIRRFRF